MQFIHSIYRTAVISASATVGLTLLANIAIAADPVTVVSWGGTYGEAQDAALFNDASKNSGIEIIRESGASMSKACLQVESGSVSWDLVVTGSGGSASAAAKGCLEEIEPSCHGTLRSMANQAVKVLHNPGPIFGMLKNFQEPELIVRTMSMVL